jgi:hypothetical protein
MLISYAKDAEMFSNPGSTFTDSNSGPELGYIFDNRPIPVDVVIIAAVVFQT